MKKIKVRISGNFVRSYDIIIGITLNQIARYIFKKFSERKIFILTDNNVEKLYGKKFADYFIKIGAKVSLLSFKAGEKSKTRNMKEVLEDKLISYGANRTSLILALGGGVVGDLAGFIAATLFRGIPYIQVPTTLLSQVDSSVGGKVGVDHPYGKNLIGAFYPPEDVLIDTSVLRTLTRINYLNGLAEVIKYGAILDPELFRLLESNSKLLMKPSSAILKNIISRCCQLKAKVVSKDEKENSYRRILNFGHTIGHAIELLSDYKIPHGFAIATGMAVEADFSVKLGLLQKNEFDRIKNLLSTFGFKTNLPRKYSMNDYLRAIQVDKKSSDYGINFTLLRKIGKAEINFQLNEQDLETLLMFYDLR
ncbi:MAG: 3-dehydroquinate synthase [Ignavibacteriae bacterium]|nr:MAG: 3-dehydroquinate synthase [Ignavibacteriota bacterium]